MIARKYRIPKEKIPYILKKGDQYTSALFIIKYTKNIELFFRYRVIISKKIDKSAVKRNKLRRQIYEAIRLHSTNTELEGKKPLKNNSNCDILLIPKKNILLNSYKEIEKDIINNIIKKWKN